MVLPVVLEAVAPLSCTNQHLAKARPRSLPRSVVMALVMIWPCGGKAFKPWCQVTFTSHPSPSSSAPRPIVVHVVTWAVAILATLNSLKAKGAPCLPSRVVKWTTTRGPFREG
uniref:Uncharacterized protein n=1 Tax=Solanum tuberosum TaxID=4113 RepID=M1DNA8_SOLTU